MGTTEELLTALDERLLEAIKGKATPEGVAKLAEARAWITNPDQATRKHALDVTVGGGCVWFIARVG